ncbi:MAG: hypothetical protein M3O70_08840 [Actinomycetota bacterium]|nr:hypothetical protein [Actinomycetota bacterium]
MPSGGARSRSGPSPDPDALRRERDGDGWRTLPAAGRKGPPPEWPLPRPTKREQELWAREWARPQALVWEANGQEVEVALYVRLLRTCESPNTPTTAVTELRRQMDALGLTIPGLSKNRWRIVDEAAAPQRTERTSPAGGPSARERLKVLQGGG